MCHTFAHRWKHLCSGHNGPRCCVSLINWNVRNCCRGPPNTRKPMNIDDICIFLFYHIWYQISPPYCIRLGTSHIRSSLEICLKLQLGLYIAHTKNPRVAHSQHSLPTCQRSRHSCVTQNLWICVKTRIGETQSNTQQRSANFRVCRPRTILYLYSNSVYAF